MVRAAELLERGEGDEAIGRATASRTLPARQARRQARAIGRPAAERALRAAEAADHAVKTGRRADALALELLVAGLARGSASRARRPARAGR